MKNGVKYQEGLRAAEENWSADIQINNSHPKELRNFHVRLGSEEVVINSKAMQQVFNYASKLHEDRGIPVFIEGETGTGKDIVARYIHLGGVSISAQPFVAVNCAALTHSIFESELFGYEPGAFTGAVVGGRKGKLDMAEGGTLFLDEITEMPVNTQAKLLRVLEEKKYYRVGGVQPINTNTRIICASNRDIKNSIQRGLFRQDLYYRLAVGHLYIPPLRERCEDIIPLTSLFLLKFARAKGKRFQSIAAEAADVLVSYKWPGNVREMRNVIEWAVLLYDDIELKPKHLNPLYRHTKYKTVDENADQMILSSHDFLLPQEGFNLQEFCTTVVMKALEMNGGNKTTTAKYLGISRSSLYTWLRKINSI